IFTFSKYKDGRPMLDHLREKLVKKGIVLEPRDPQEVYEKIVSTEENKYIAKLVKLICQFIHNFKANGYSMDMFRDMRNQSNNVRTQLFLDVCRQCFMEYTQKLDDANAVDFEDMINDSAKILKQQREKGARLDYKYIIIDEYQDISRQRFNLAKELSEISDAKIIAVGDDWQSIFAYAGSDISLFTKFSEIMGYGEELLITRTYRNSQEVIDVAGNFIQKNSSQIRKHLESPKHIEMPFVVEAYSEETEKKDTDGKNGKLQQQATAIDKVIGQIVEANKAEGKPANSSILLIGRYGFDASNLARTGRYVYNEKTGDVKSMAFPDVNITFLTAHRSKGLGFDNVIIINATNGTYGFPSMIEDDPVMQLVIHSDRAIEYAEERRLFYVAMTRTKNRVYIVVPQNRPSRFIAELVQDYPGIKVNGELDIDKTVEPVISVMRRCPVCGYPMQYKYKRDFGLRLWICTNEPEICDFMTNDLKGGTLPILKCDRCSDGYLIVKRGKGRTEPFLGCTNYKADKTGCDGFMTREYYDSFIKNQSF
ncbi:MAG: UvrD-helicase domain-containing protein, partial [Bacteroidales bacterium]|nr:UvrD-helicase domain-containing protein [Bacteroidales bacterium]